MFTKNVNTWQSIQICTNKKTVKLFFCMFFMFCFVVFVCCCCSFCNLDEFNKDT